MMSADAPIRRNQCPLAAPGRLCPLITYERDRTSPAFNASPNVGEGCAGPRKPSIGLFHAFHRQPIGFLASLLGALCGCTNGCTLDLGSTVPQRCSDATALIYAINRCTSADSLE